MNDRIVIASALRTGLGSLHGGSAESAVEIR